MASTTAEKRASRKKYATDKRYREKKIAGETAKHKRNRPKYAKEMREYYDDNEKYRKWKRAYAKKYRRENPVKSKPRKDR